MKEKDKYEKMKDNLRSQNEKSMFNDTTCKQCIKLWDWAVQNHFFKNNMYVSQCTCLADTSCFATYKMESYCLKYKKKYRKHRSTSFKY